MKTASQTWLFRMYMCDTKVFIFFFFFGGLVCVHEINGLRYENSSTNMPISEYNGTFLGKGARFLNRKKYFLSVSASCNSQTVNFTYVVFTPVLNCHAFILVLM